MPAAPHPSVYTIPINRGFADALAAGLLARARGDRLALARAIVLLPNNRAQRAITDAFVRRAEGGLLLPRLVSIGDPELDDRIGPLFDPAGDDAIPPAIDPLARQLILARLIGEARKADPIEPVEAVRLAADLAGTLDQMIVEGVPPARLADAVPGELSEHWQASLEILQIVLRRWPEELARRNRIDLADRRNRLLTLTERRWSEQPPEGLIVAAGITVAAPAVARLLRRIARLPQGRVVLAGLDRAMPEAEWEALGGAEGQRPVETHPQYALKQLLDRMGVARSEVRPWRAGRDGASPDRARAAGNAMTPAAFTDKWQSLPARARRLSGVRAIELPNPAAEAQAIAIALRESVEMPGRTAALVTPDRALAGRVAAHLRRWGIEADDSAGRPLSRTPPGTLLSAIADAAAEAFAPVALLALLKHPLVRAGEHRLEWLDGVRLLDRALRGPRPGPGLVEITRFLEEGDDRTRRPREAALERWRDILPLLQPLEAAFAVSAPRLGDLLDAIVTASTALAGDEAWSRPAGRAAAELIAGLQASAEDGPRAIEARALPAFLQALADAVAVRPPQGGHPRVFIWGLIEARLQQTDLVVLGGLNEGVWPSLPAPDPWLAPAIRATLGLPGLERRIGLEAQQFAAGLGGPEVLLTRARRDARAPAVASRFWLRLVAMTGGVAPHRTLERWAAGLDRPPDFAPAARPAPRPPVADRPSRLAVTKLDRLKADPYAFYADTMLRLRAWDSVDADPSAAWRGSAVHAVFEAWIKQDDCDPDRLRPRAEQLLRETAAHPVLRALWAPRLLEAIDWVAGEVRDGLAAGRRPIAAERKGVIDVAGIRLEGTVDRIDRLADGTLAIVDWKTGKPPSKRAVAEGYSMQLGLLGLIAEQGGFEGLSGVPTAFEYWSLAAGKDRTLGYVTSPVGLNKQGDGIDSADFTSRAARVLTGAVEQYLKADAPFIARLHPEYAPYGDYDQLMRLDEWYGRGPAGEAA
ncbi:double-strand break repair protein AddB [Sphingomonas crusticola]|uniref:double-strand break repair protein AddB n=1 Tax=Sphingomonas crusticola TaxID=1697973 RepID=UPI001F085A18|nr:double-strand break repair protein AddB [Sphingomonas crusticola]